MLLKSYQFFNRHLPNVRWSAKRTLICQKKIFVKKCYFPRTIWCGSCWKILKWYLVNSQDMVNFDICNLVECSVHPTEVLWFFKDYAGKNEVCCLLDQICVIGISSKSSGKHIVFTFCFVFRIRDFKLLLLVYFFYFS